ncbi:hypothetical protein PROFUN_06031 [Planoprotostelium fungivorum]|uniref:Uncharacterized protein n=1 Tax=Planoprotostelium fungivorum TaxID=1890364 RepID=A0A2P6NPM3_9EUKA|nr:hypothetical protein PROFUN_06031 [Planoprotostelium fungivorum]
MVLSSINTFLKANSLAIKRPPVASKDVAVIDHVSNLSFPMDCPWRSSLEVSPDGIIILRKETGYLEVAYANRIARKYIGLKRSTTLEGQTSNESSKSGENSTDLHTEGHLNENFWHLAVDALTEKKKSISLTSIGGKNNITRYIIKLSFIQINENFINAYLRGYKHEMNIRADVNIPTIDDFVWHQSLLREANTCGALIEMSPSQSDLRIVKTTKTFQSVVGGAITVGHWLSSHSNVSPENRKKWCDSLREGVGKIVTISPILLPDPANVHYVCARLRYLETVDTLTGALRVDTTPCESPNILYRYTITYQSSFSVKKPEDKTESESASAIKFASMSRATPNPTTEKNYHPASIKMTTSSPSITLSPTVQSVASSAPANPASPSVAVPANPASPSVAVPASPTPVSPGSNRPYKGVANILSFWQQKSQTPEPPQRPSRTPSQLVLNIPKPDKAVTHTPDLNKVSEALSREMNLSSPTMTEPKLTPRSPRTPREGKTSTPSQPISIPTEKSKKTPTPSPGTTGNFDGKSEDVTLDAKREISQNPEKMIQSLKLNRTVLCLLARRELRKRKKMHRYRTKVVEEITSTEEIYLRYLTRGVEFLNELRKTNICTPQDITTMFGPLESILKLSEILSADLRQCTENWNPSTPIGVIFVKYSKFFHTYGPYVQNFDAAGALTRQFQSDPEFHQLWVKMNPDLEKFPELFDIIIRPVQRIPRYKLLLTDLVKHTWKSHIDFVELHKAIDHLNKVALHVNDDKRKFDDSQKLVALRQKLSGQNTPDIVTPSRKYLREMDISVHNDHYEEGLSGKKRMVILCNDALIMIKPRQQQEKMETKSIRLNFKSITQFEDVLSVNAVGGADQLIEVVEKGSSKYYLEFPSVEEKQVWLNDMKALQQTARKERKKRFSAQGMELSDEDEEVHEVTTPQNFQRVKHQTIDLENLNKVLRWKWTTPDDRSRYFGKKGFFVKDATEDDFIFSVQPSKKWLTRSGKKYSKELTIMCKMIGCIMLDFPPAPGEDVGAMPGLMRNRMSGNQELTDEVLCQIIRQLNKHPFMKHCLNGWSLLLDMIHNHLYPSRNLEPFVRVFLNLYLDGDKLTPTTILASEASNLLDARPPPTQSSMSPLLRSFGRSSMRNSQRGEAISPHTRSESPINWKNTLRMVCTRCRGQKNEGDSATAMGLDVLHVRVCKMIQNSRQSYALDALDTDVADHSQVTVSLPSSAIALGSLVENFELTTHSSSKNEARMCLSRTLRITATYCANSRYCLRNRAVGILRRKGETPPYRNRTQEPTEIAPPMEALLSLSSEGVVLFASTDGVKINITFINPAALRYLSLNRDQVDSVCYSRRDGSSGPLSGKIWNVVAETLFEQQGQERRETIRLTSMNHTHQLQLRAITIPEQPNTVALFILENKSVLPLWQTDALSFEEQQWMSIVQGATTPIATLIKWNGDDESECVRSINTEREKDVEEIWPCIMKIWTSRMDICELRPGDKQLVRDNIKTRGGRGRETTTEPKLNTNRDLCVVVNRGGVAFIQKHTKNQVKSRKRVRLQDSTGSPLMTPRGSSSDVTLDVTQFDKNFDFDD